MLLKPPSVPPTIFETFPRIARNAAKAATTTTVSSSPFTPAPNPYLQQSRLMASTGAPSGEGFASYGIENVNINTASGVSLSDSQKLLVGSVLDLFAGRPSKRKLTLWNDDAVFADPLTIAEGRKQYEAQWYGLKAAFSEIQRLNSQVTSSGNPIEMDMTTKYVVKGLGSEQTINSKILIHLSKDGNKIIKVEDKWDGSIPEGAFAKAMRNLNSVAVPAFVSVPKSVEEEEAKQK